jgi:branched-chain amino acid transport system ATP-binding protein
MLSGPTWGRRCRVLLNVHQLKAGYGNLIVLREISFLMSVGETLAVIGSNGAGKSTLLWALSGMIRPKSGQVWFGEQEITGWDCSRIVSLGIGHVLQGMHVFSSLMVEDNLILGAYAQRSNSEWFRDRNLQIVYKYFPVLERKRRQHAGSLSGGEKQMLAIGRTLMCKLKLLLLDEPSAGLAPLLVKHLFEILSELREKFSLTILLVEQNAEAALRFSHRGLVMGQGQMMLEGGARSLINNEKVREIYLGKGEKTPNVKGNG